MKIRNLLLVALTAALLMGGALSAAADGGFRLPKYEKFVLKNGLTVYLMEHHEVPLIYVSAVVPAGAVKDGKAGGLASLTAEALLFGTKNYTKGQIEEQLDFLGADYNTGARLETANITASFAKKDLNTVLPIVKEIFTAPVFDQKEFDKYKKRLLTELELAKERPARVIGSYFNKFVFADHAYGNPVRGGRTTVAGLGVEDVKKFYAANYKPSESAIALVGDFDTAEMKKTVGQWFGGWNAAGTSAKMADKPPATFAKSRLLLVNKDDATETQFRIGTLGIKRSNPDYVAIQVINTILGGRFTSWLNDELRVNAGLTYGARSNFSTYRQAGTFAVASYTRTAKTTEAIDLALEVLERLHKKGLDAATLDSAKNYIKGQYPPRYETAGRLADLLTDMFVFGFDESFINDFQKNVDRLTLEGAGKMIKKYFPVKNLQFVLIGKAEAIRDKVKKYGPISEKEIKAEGF